MRSTLVLVALATPAQGDDHGEPAPVGQPDRMQQLEDELARLKEDNAALERRVDDLGAVSARLSGYLDVGFFAASSFLRKPATSSWYG